MPKRRVLTPGQQVLIVYRKKFGFTEQLAEFIEYRPVQLESVSHSTPFFRYEDQELSGLECFWVLVNEFNPASLKRLQYDIIRLQIRVLELSANLEYNMPVKVDDPELKSREFVKKLGYDPKDESWLETDLADNDRERNWFRFERENAVTFYHLLYESDWSNIVRLFNDQFNDSVTIDEARKLSMRRMRYVMGATAIRLSGNPNRTEWKRLAKEFDETHEKVEKRMFAWSEGKKNNFPLVRTKKELPFNAGPYFNDVLEKIPQYFTDPQCKAIRVGSMLRVVSYDPEKGCFRVDFPAEIRSMIKPNEKDPKPWESLGGDYLIFVCKGDLNDGFEFVDGSL